MPINYNSERMVELRAKAQVGDLTLDEMQEAVTLMRQGRPAAAVVAKKSRTTKAKQSDKVETTNQQATELLDTLFNTLG